MRNIFFAPHLLKSFDATGNRTALQDALDGKEPDLEGLESPPDSGLEGNPETEWAEATTTGTRKVFHVEHSHKSASGVPGPGLPYLSPGTFHPERFSRVSHTVREARLLWRPPIRSGSPPAQVTTGWSPSAIKLQLSGVEAYRFADWLQCSTWNTSVEDAVEIRPNRFTLRRA